MDEEPPMTPFLIAPGPIYTFLSYCNASRLEKEVLDCGAGGASPPLTVFREHGYQTHGVEISRKQLELAQRFSSDHGLDLDISLGDMRQLPYSDASMSFIYSYNSICHMTKTDVGVTMGEIRRVLRPRGLCFVNFLSVHDGRHGQGPKLGPGEYAYEEEGERGLHSFFEEGEPDPFFTGFEVLRRATTRVESTRNGITSVWGDLPYIAQKL
jgi:ubiquinone/menaquinone biosynthesis C-methylase UbiE